jgi:hypothetical protein
MSRRKRVRRVDLPHPEALARRYWRAVNAIAGEVAKLGDDRVIVLGWIGWAADFAEPLFFPGPMAVIAHPWLVVIVARPRPEALSQLRAQGFAEVAESLEPGSSPGIPFISLSPIGVVTYQLHPFRPELN